MELKQFKSYSELLKAASNAGQVFAATGTRISALQHFTFTDANGVPRDIYGFRVQILTEQVKDADGKVIENSQAYEAFCKLMEKPQDEKLTNFTKNLDLYLSASYWEGQLRVKCRLQNEKDEE